MDIKRKTNAGKTPSATVEYLARGAVIAASYVLISLLLKPLSYGMFQLRVSEAFTIMPIFMIEAVPALFVGCFITNLFSPNFLPADLIFGSLATLIAAILTRKLRHNKILAMTPPVIVNAVVIPFIIALSVTDGESFLSVYLTSFLFILIEQALVVYIFGTLLYKVFEKYYPVLSNNPDFRKS